MPATRAPRNFAVFSLRRRGFSTTVAPTTAAISAQGRLPTAIGTVDDADEPVWDSVIPVQEFIVGVPVSLDLNDFVTPDSPYIQLIAGSIASLPGLTLNGSVIEGTPTDVTDSDVSLTFVAASTSYDAEWATDSAAAGVLQAENWEDYSTRGELMDYLRSIEEQNPSDGVRNAYTNVEFGGSQAQRYMDPIPPGEEEKISLVTNNYVTAGRSVYLRLRASEGATEAGPVIELPISAPASRYYVRLVLRADSDLLAHDYQTGDGMAKICFLDHLNFVSGQIVANMIDGQGWMTAYRVYASGSAQFRNNHATGPSPYGQNYQIYSAWDQGGSAATANAWDLRFGPSRDNDNRNDADFVNVPRLRGNTWQTICWYIDQDYSGTLSRGMWKVWMADLGDAPQLISCNFRNCDFPSFASKQAQSIRITFRPENSAAGNPVDAGIHFDSVLVTTDPPNFPGGHVLPYSGQQVPSWLPIAGTTDEH